MKRVIDIHNKWMKRKGYDKAYSESEDYYQEIRMSLIKADTSEQDRVSMNKSRLSPDFSKDHRTLENGQ